MTFNQIYRWDNPHALIGDLGSGPEAKLAHRCIILTIMKNEAPYIIEWATYHYAMGFREIVVFSNFSDDYTDQILERLDDLGIVRHRPHPINIFPQVGQLTIASLRFARCLPQYKASDYMMMIDADEFLEVRLGNNSLNALFAAEEPFEVASFIMVGRNAEDNQKINDGRLLERFLLESGSESGRRGSHSVKSLARTHLPKGFHRNHRPRVPGFSQLGLRWIDGTGREHGPSFTDRRVSSVKANAKEHNVRINHYAIRSAEAFMVKVQRGASSHHGRNEQTDAAVAQWADYWKMRNASCSHPGDRPKEPPHFRALLSEIASDPILAELHEAALEVHRQKAKAVMDSDFGQMVAKEIGFI